jgi:hypothetical protein
MYNDSTVLSTLLQPFFFNPSQIPMFLWIYTMAFITKDTKIINSYKHCSRTTLSDPNIVQYSKFQGVHTKAITALSYVTEVPAYTLHGQILIPCKTLQIFPLTTRSSILLSCL